MFCFLLFRFSFFLFLLSQLQSIFHSIECQACRFIHSSKCVNNLGCAFFSSLKWIYKNEPEINERQQTQWKQQQTFNDSVMSSHNCTIYKFVYWMKSLYARTFYLYLSLTVFLSVSLTYIHLLVFSSPCCFSHSVVDSFIHSFIHSIRVSEWWRSSKYMLSINKRYQFSYF